MRYLILQKIAPAEEVYAAASSELIAAVKDLDGKITGSYANWFKRLAKAEAEFLAGAAAAISDSSDQTDAGSSPLISIDSILLAFFVTLILSDLVSV